MERVWRLRDWLTLEQAATQLSSRVEDEVSKADIIQLALEKKLQISTFLPYSCPAFEGELDREPLYTIFTNREKGLPERFLSDLREADIPEDVLSNLQESTLDAVTKKTPGSSYLLETGERVVIGGEQFFFRVDTKLESVSRIEGVLDLLLVSNDYEQLYDLLSEEIGGRPSEDRISLGGVILKPPGEGSLCYELAEPFEKAERKLPYYHRDNFFPCPYLPESQRFVVRPAALDRFVKDYFTFEQEVTERGSLVPQAPLLICLLYTF